MTMIAQPIPNEDPLFAGFYSVADASRILGLSGTRKLRGWINGWSQSKAEPVIDRDFKQTNTISFLDLIEVRFIEHFRGQGVPMQTLRKAAAKARTEWGAKHPFALGRLKYFTDRKSIFAQVAKEDGDKKTWDLATGQHEIWEAIEAVVAKGVEFDAKTDLAHRWRPNPGFPSVVIDPKIAFGKPVVEETGVPTAVLYRQYLAEGDYGAVADLYRTERSVVETAVAFEIAAAA